jgi:hypothetical protein
MKKSKAPKAERCSVCGEGDLVPSGCGCANEKCSNFVEKWTKLVQHAPPRPPKKG